MIEFVYRGYAAGSRGLFVLSAVARNDDEGIQKLLEMAGTNILDRTSITCNGKPLRIGQRRLGKIWPRKA